MNAGIDAVMPARLLTAPRVDLSRHDIARSFVRVIAVGKAAEGMATAAIAQLRGRDFAGVVIAPAVCRVDRRLETLVGGHPVPTAQSETAGRRALELADACGPDDVLIVLISGGASALMAVPADEVSLAAKRETTSTLLRVGAEIHQLNAVRKHLSAIKGGLLAVRNRGATLGYALSDVVGDDLSVIGSGPTVADETTFEDALTVMERSGGIDAYPRDVVRRIGRGVAGEVAETPKPGDPRLSRAHTAIVGGRREAMAGAAHAAYLRGYHVVVLPDPIVGAARLAGHTFVKDAVEAATQLPACVIASGETTVKVTGAGRGGRNQELAAGAAAALGELRIAAAMASVGTDGVDGPTDAAGAIADDTTIKRAGAAGLPPVEQVLAANDSYSYFDALGDLVRTGPTGTNVGDLQILLLP